MEKQQRASEESKTSAMFGEVQRETDRRIQLQTQVLQSVTVPLTLISYCKGQFTQYSHVVFVFLFVSVFLLKMTLH